MTATVTGLRTVDVEGQQLVGADAQVGLADVAPASRRQHEQAVAGHEEHDVGVRRDAGGLDHGIGPAGAVTAGDDGDDRLLTLEQHPLGRPAQHPARAHPYPSASAGRR